ncbi:hypothetical protein Tco_1085711 [Tanacetum coccineum]
MALVHLGNPSNSDWAKEIKGLDHLTFINVYQMKPLTENSICRSEAMAKVFGVGVGGQLLGVVAPDVGVVPKGL